MSPDALLVVCRSGELGCGKTLPKSRMRQRLELFSRTTGAGGTLSKVKLIAPTGDYLCDDCVRAEEHRRIEVETPWSQGTLA